MKYNREIILKRYNSGEKMNFIFFWGHTAFSGKINKTCLSQWYPVNFEIDKIQYHTAEQYMMSQKSLLFNDKEIYKKIMAANNPKNYKSLGRKIRNFNEKVWNEHKFEIVLNGNIAKFSQNLELKKFLLETEDSIIVEASPYDSIWGVNMALDNPDIQNPNNWKGENLLGFVLMETRFILKNKE